MNTIEKIKTRNEFINKTTVLNKEIKAELESFVRNICSATEFGKNEFGECFVREIKINYPYGVLSEYEFVDKNIELYYYDSRDSEFNKLILPTYLLEFFVREDKTSLEKQDYFVDYFRVLEKEYKEKLKKSFEINKKEQEEKNFEMLKLYAERCGYEINEKKVSPKIGFVKYG